MVASEDEQNLANMEISEDPTVDPELDRSRFLAILVECLAKLNAVSYVMCSDLHLPAVLSLIAQD